MKTKTLLAIAISATMWASCSEKKSGEEAPAEETVASVTVSKETFCGKGRTCWTLTSGPSMFGTEICFNDNGTANMGEGFGPYTAEGSTMTLKDNNGVAISAGTTLTFEVKAADEKSFTLISNGKDMVFTKK